MTRILAALGAVALAAALSFPVMAAPAPLALVQNWKTIACNVEQQTIHVYGSFDGSVPCPDPTVVNNPTGCPWDIDDAWSMTGSGSLRVGAVVTASLCAVADGTHKAPVDAQVGAKHPYLVVRLDASDGRSWTAIPVRSGSQYLYTICADNFIQLFPHPEVAGSNGGRGTLVTYTLTIDATTRGGSDIRAMFKYGQGIMAVAACEP